MERTVIKIENEIIDNTVIMSADIGYGNVKACFMQDGKIQEIIFKSNVQQGEALLSQDDFIVDGVNYFFTQEASEIVEIGSTTKDSDLHRILLYRAMYLVARKLKKTNVNFKIMLTCPLYSYKSDKGATQLKALTSKKKGIKIHDGVNAYTFNILDADITPETVASCFALPSKIANIREDKLILCDLGNKNISIVDIDGKPNIAESTATVTGMDYVKQRLLEIAKANPTWNIQTVRDMERYLKSADDESINQVVFNSINDDIFKDVDAIMRKLGSNVRGAKILFLGGGSVLLGQFIKKKWNEENICFVPNPVTATVRGALARALKKFKL